MSVKQTVIKAAANGIEITHSVESIKCTFNPSTAAVAIRTSTVEEGGYSELVTIRTES